ncbi:hypothetical protein L7F22_025775 [Adiantum nelumboides]|nr:hypothetical protein [Adiantum nelumboides]
MLYFDNICLSPLFRIKNMDSKKPLSILCRSFQDIDTYTTGFPRGNSQGNTNVFRAARQCLPGPYTFILPASKEMPKQCTNFGGAAESCAPRKSVGVRMPNDVICDAILRELDNPLICTSVRRPANDNWLLDPVIIADTYGASERKEGVDFVVDAGVRIADPSTVVDMTGVLPLLLRRGKFMAFHCQLWTYLWIWPCLLPSVVALGVVDLSIY